jgi:hypothetical protein
MSDKSYHDIVYNPPVLSVPAIEGSPVSVLQDAQHLPSVYAVRSPRSGLILCVQRVSCAEELALAPSCESEPDGWRAVAGHRLQCKRLA